MFGFWFLVFFWLRPVLVAACWIFVAVHGLLFVHGVQFSCPAACGILVPRPQNEPASSALGACSLTHWTTREVPQRSFNTTNILCICLSVVISKMFYSPRTNFHPLESDLPFVENAWARGLNGGSHAC